MLVTFTLQIYLKANFQRYNGQEYPTHTPLGTEAFINDWRDTKILYSFAINYIACQVVESIFSD